MGAAVARRASLWPCVVVLVGVAGCVSYLHPIDRPRPDCLEPCLAVPKCARDHVYVFFVHGMDPCNYANLSGLVEYVQTLGFHKTYYGQLYHQIHFDHEIRRVLEKDPEARIVLVGYSFGANVVRNLAQSAARQGIAIDLLFYVGGNTLRNTPEDQPDNAIEIVHVLSSGWDWMGEPIDRAENINIPEVYHFGTVTHPETCRALARHLAELAANIPIEDKPEAPIAPLDDAPMPPPIMTHTAQKPSETPASSGDWGFLEPSSRLQMPAPLQRPADARTRSGVRVTPDWMKH